MNELLILTEAGRGIGMGHYSRCCAVQEAAHELGVPSKMILNEIGTRSLPVKGCHFDWLKDAEACRAEYIDRDVSVLIDSYLAPRQILELFMGKSGKLSVLDDYNRMDYPVDLLINPNVYFLLERYDSQSARCVGGQDYVILRRPFREAPISPGRTTPSARPRILLTLGGDDFRKLLLRLSSLLDGFGVEVEVIGANKEMAEKIKHAHPRFEVHQRLEAQAMCDVMQRADLVISGCGQTLHELAALRKRTIGIYLDHDQAGNRDYYEGNGFMEALDWDDPKLESKLSKLLRDFLEGRYADAQPRDCLPDRKGVYRLVNELL